MSHMQVQIGSVWTFL